MHMVAFYFRFGLPSFPSSIFRTRSVVVCTSGCRQQATAFGVIDDDSVSPAVNAARAESG